MNQEPDEGKARTINSVIDYEFYRNRPRRLHEGTVTSGIGDFVYHAITRLTIKRQKGGFWPQVGYC